MKVTDQLLKQRRSTTYEWELAADTTAPFVDLHRNLWIRISIQYGVTRDNTDFYNAPAFIKVFVSGI